MQEMKAIILVSCLVQFSFAETIVETNSGPIRSTAALSDDVDAFLGVPYAEPPVGDLRFAKPVPKKPWNEVYDASKPPPACMQAPMPMEYYYSTDRSDMSEDCLYLNVWAPKAKPDGGPRPVVIYIHPGSFVFGSSTQREFDGSRLASRGDMVVVTINYRLGSLGFFLAYVEEADGNMAMYDQLLAIQWVKDNAKHFGGDPENIIPMGTSAGSMSISAHMVSPLSQNLFKRAIMMSGSLLNPMFMDENARLFENSQNVAGIVGCTNETMTLRSDPRSVVKCLKERPREAFAEAEYTLMMGGHANLFYPRSNDPFLPKAMASMVREGKFRRDIDALFGMNEEEGTLLMVLALYEYLGQYGHLPMAVTKVRAAGMIKMAGLAVGIEIPREVVKYYLNTNKNRTSDGYRKVVTNGLGDFGLVCGSVFFADFLSLKGNGVHFYKFGFRAASTPNAEWMGVTHLDDIQYLFGNPYHENFTAEEVELSHRLMDRVSAFSRTGNPNVPGEMPWLPYSHHNPLYLHIGQEEEDIRMRPEKRCEIWRQIFKSDIDSDLIRFLRNSGMNVTAEEDS